MQAFGADLETMPSEDGKITGALIRGMIERAEAIAQEQESYSTDQFNNRDSLVGYAGIGRELVQQLPGIDLFCAAVGTAGMIMGVASELRKLQPRPRIVVLEPTSSAVISTGKSGAHRVEGTAVGFVPPLLDLDVVDEVRTVDEEEARVTARRLAAEEGIFAGTSSGLNVAAALQLAQEMGPGHIVATVACDTGLKYLAGDLFDV
jgi:cysteine synthase A